MKEGIVVDKQNIFYREPGNEYLATCDSEQNEWAHCVLEKDYTLTFISGDYRCGGVILSKSHYKHRNAVYWLAVETFLGHLAKNELTYYKEIMQMIISNNAHTIIADKITISQLLNLESGPNEN